MTNLLPRIMYLLLLISLTLTPANGKAQSQDEIIQTILSGTSSELAKYFNNTLSLNIYNNSGDYSNNQAELILRDFFRKFPPKDFEVVHKGAPNEAIWFFIGNYKSEEADFKVLVKGKQDDESLKIYSMDFKKE